MAVFGCDQISTELSVSAAEIKLDLKLSSQIETTELYGAALPGLARGLRPLCWRGGGRGGLRGSVFLDLLQHLAEEHVEQALELVVPPRGSCQAWEPHQRVDDPGELELSLQQLLQVL